MAFTLEEIHSVQTKSSDFDNCFSIRRFRLRNCIDEQGVGWTRVVLNA
jgi:hypothetical protein